MDVLKNLSIGVRLALAFGLLILLILATTLITRSGLESIRGDMDVLLKDTYVKVKLVNEIGEDVNLHARLLRNLLIMDRQEDRETEIKTLLGNRGKLSDRYSQLQARLKTAEGKALYAKVQEVRAEFEATEDKMIKEVQAGEAATAKGLLLTELRPRQLAYQERLQVLIEFQEHLLEEAGQSTIGTIGRVNMSGMVVTVLGLLLAVAASALVTRSVTQPVGQLVRTLEQVASGDLTVQVKVDSRDEIGQLQHALAGTVTGLRTLIGKVRSGVDTVTTASGQIAAGNQDLSARTEQQASSLQQTASSMEELTATVRQSADTARAASNLSANASAAASHGGDAVGQVVGTMEDIHASSRKIVDIIGVIGVIDGIAFQTNILALNAAVEAARAGEQGRGFAVVATEVRVLAQRSAEAAKEIKSLIGTSVEKVEAGSKQAADAGLAMRDIVSEVHKVRDLIGEIAGTAGEQSRGIEQVNAAVTQMDHVTQQNAALVEQSAAAAASLAQQAKALADAVSRFRV